MFSPPPCHQTDPSNNAFPDLPVVPSPPANLSDMMADRKVIWDPVNCNHGPGDEPIAEAYLCRAHDTDGCRFCHDSCDGFEVRRSRHNFWLYYSNYSCSAA